MRRRRALPVLAFAASLAFTACLTFAPPPARAQLTVFRTAPKDVVLGKMTVTTPPAIEIDGKPDRLSAGSRIRSVSDMLVLSGSLAGQTVPVLYRREATTGLVHEVWMLTDDEYKQLAKASGSGSDGVQQFLSTLATLWAARGR